VQGSWNLHTLLGNSLSFFVILSSYSGIFGNRGQSNYAAAGTYQDALSYYRRSHGQQCTTIDLGIMRDIGVIAEKGASGDLKNWEKPFGIRESVFHALMISILSASSEGANVPAQVVTGLATRDGVSAANIDVPFYFNNPRFSILSKHGGKNNTLAHPNTNEAGSVPAKIQLARAASLSEATDIVTDLLIRKLAKSLQTETSEIDSGRPLHSYGVDSLVALEIRNWAILEIGAEITVFDVLSSVPMTALARVVAGKSKLLSEGVV
jgi:zearalenone synthase (highly reducing iterative type I polyketide synthase)